MSTTQPFATDAARWRAVVARNAAARGAFFYAVRTTGVYCRPDCSARRPGRANVEFHATAAEAERAGFRPCRHCRPEQAAEPDRIIAAACRTLAEAQAAPTLHALAAAAGLSPFHFHHRFRAATGVTPRAYFAAARRKRLQDELAGAGTVTEAFYGAGFGSSAGFYARARAELGMRPKRALAAGSGEQIRYAVAHSSLGPVLVAGSRSGVCAIALGDDAAALERDLRKRFAGATLDDGNAAFARLVRSVVALVDDPARGHTLPLDVRGTAFQQRVWQALQLVPAGKTSSYAELARRLGVPRSVRAVARAVASNALAVAVPCHRAVRSDGSLAGYRWGVERKKKLLALEAPKRR